MIDAEWAREFAQEWVESWNSHDLKRILSHYADDFEMQSPLIIERFKGSSGSLKGKERVGAYWQASLSATPPLRFEIIDALVGVDSVTLYYRSIGRRVVAETLVFNQQRKIVKGMSHWSVMGYL